MVKPRPEKTGSAGRSLAALRQALLAEEAAILARDLDTLARIGPELQLLFSSLHQARPAPEEAADLAAPLQEVAQLRAKNLRSLRFFLEEAAEERRLLGREKLFLQAYHPGGDGSGTRLHKKC